MSNAHIAQLLQEVAAAYIIKDEAKYRFQIIAYQKAADAIEHATTEVSELLKEGKLELLPGIGTSIRTHIEELLQKGKSSRFEEARQGVPEAVFPLLAIPTFGPKKAYKIVSAYNLNSQDTVIEDVENLGKAGKIAVLPGFGEKSQQDLLRAIVEFRAGSGKVSRMVLPVAFELASKLLAYLKQSQSIKKADVLGSLRRMKDTVGDIDIAVATDKPEVAIEHFTKYPHVERIIEKGTLSASILVRGGRQVDLMVMPPESYGSLLQHFTGSKNHNIKLREHALKLGMSLSEKGIKRVKKGKTVLDTFSTEESFYEALGLAWVPPELREDTGEVEASIHSLQGKANGLPDLVELKDIKGDFHIHSSYPIEPSHDLGQDTMEAMLKKAESLGYTYFGFSEHNPSVANHTKDDVYRIMEARKNKIEQLKKSNKYIRILNLLELDILASGELAIDSKALAYVDAVLVSIHSSFGMEKEEMTRRVLAGLSHPKAKILSHPTGRLLNDRRGYDLDWEEIFTFCKSHNKALEINAWPQRLDLPDTLVREAVAAGVSLVIDTDSHAVSQMDMMRYGVAVARRGWTEKHDIINTKSSDEVMEWFRS